MTALTPFLCKEPCAPLQGVPTGGSGRVDNDKEDRLKTPIVHSQPLLLWSVMSTPKVLPFMTKRRRLRQLPVATCLSFFDWHLMIALAFPIGT